MEKDNTINLLLEYLGKKSSAEIAGRLAETSSEEWQQLLELAGQHGVSPLLYSRLEPFFSDYKIPSEIIEQLRSAYYGTAIRNTLFYSELSQVLDALNRDDIPVILLKGVYLAEKVYGNIALRSMQDIDLLLKKDDLDMGKDVLISLGYSPVKPIYTEFETTQHRHISQLIKGKLAIELHWNVSSPGDPFNVDINQLWERAKEKKIAENTVLVPCPEDLLLHLCIHTSYPYFSQATIRSFYDIRIVIEKFNDIIRWDMFVQTAFAWKAERCAYLTLFMAGNIFAVDVPENVMAELQPKDFSPGILAMANEQLFCEDCDNYEIHPRMARIWGTEKMKDRIQLFLSEVFLSREELATRYPAPPWSFRIYLYYLVWIKDLLFRFGKGALGLARKDKAAVDLAEHRRKGVELQDWLGKGQGQG